jgi:hypothetical protein
MCHERHPDENTMSHRGLGGITGREGGTDEAVPWTPHEGGAVKPLGCELQMLLLSAAKVQQYREREEWEEPAPLDMLTSHWSSRGRLLVKEKSPVGGETRRSLATVSSLMVRLPKQPPELKSTIGRMGSD